MTRSEAKHLIDTYCEDEPTAGAVDRLMEQDLSSFDGLSDPGNNTQDKLDEILYA